MVNESAKKKNSNCFSFKSMTSCQQNNYGLDRRKIYPPIFWVTRFSSGVKSTLFSPPLLGQLTTVKFTTVNSKFGVTFQMSFTMVNLEFTTVNVPQFHPNQCDWSTETAKLQFHQPIMGTVQIKTYKNNVYWK